MQSYSIFPPCDAPTSLRTPFISLFFYPHIKPFSHIQGNSLAKPCGTFKIIALVLGTKTIKKVRISFCCEWKRLSFAFVRENSYDRISTRLVGGRAGHGDGAGEKRERKVMIACKYLESFCPIAPPKCALSPSPPDKIPNFVRCRWGRPTGERWPLSTLPLASLATFEIRQLPAAWSSGTQLENKGVFFSER